MSAASTGVEDSGGQAARSLQECIHSWEKTGRFVRRASDTHAVWGQELVLELSWKRCYRTFAMGVRLPAFVSRWDLRFIGHRSSTERAEFQNQAWASGRTAGNFCDCRGCEEGHNSSHRLDWEDLRETRAPTYLAGCCQSLPTCRLPRDSKDGHFAILYPNLRRDCLRAAWRAGAVDATWLCWACLGRRFNATFEQLVEINVDHIFGEASIAQRTRERFRHEPVSKARKTENEARYTKDAWLRHRAASLWLKISEQLQMHRDGRLTAFIAAETSALDAP